MGFYLYKKLLSCFFKNDSVKTLFLVDILYMKDINAIYDFNNGDFIIQQLEQILEYRIKKSIKTYLQKNTKISIKNTHADVFEIIIFDELKKYEIDFIKNLIYENVVSNNFKLLDNNISINIDITIGCAIASNNQIKAFAERALYDAKLNNLHFCLFESDIFKDKIVSTDLVDILNYNINNNLVEPYFQPILDNNSNKVVKYEALMRIFDRNGNIITPNLFIQKSKKSRLYNKLMEILFDKIIIYILKHKINVSMNLDYTDILNPQIKKTIISKIKANDIGSYLTFEILETEKISNFEVVNEFIKDVKKHGVKIAIDDFGTGFSNYENILNLNIDYIKIDGSLIKKIDEEIYSNLIKSIVLFSKQQCIKVVAEFVSDLKIFEYVKNIGIDFSQGYYIAKPSGIETLFGKH